MSPLALLLIPGIIGACILGPALLWADDLVKARKMRLPSKPRALPEISHETRLGLGEHRTTRRPAPFDWQKEVGL